MKRVLVALFLARWPAIAQDLIPGTITWDFPKDIVAEQRTELQRFYSKQLEGGTRLSKEELRRLIGAIDQPLPPKAVDIRSEWDPPQGEMTVSLVQWPLYRLGSLPATAGGSGFQVRMYGVLYEPRQGGRYPLTIELPDVALGAGSVSRASDRVTFVPTFVKRTSWAHPWTDDRQLLWRLAYQTGRHILGSEVVQVQSAIDFLLTRKSVKPDEVTIVGRGLSGLTARIAAALDSRIKKCLADVPAELPEDAIVWRYRDIAATLPPPDGDPPAVLVGRSNHGSGEGGPAVHQVRFWESFYRNRAIESERLRDALPLEARRKAYWETIGNYPKPEGPFEARSVKVYDTPAFTAWRLSVRVYDGVHAYGILAVPKGITLGERRPVVFTQHGLAGTPEDAMGVEETARNDVYRRFGKTLAEKGFIVFAPLVSVQEPNGRSSLVRLAHQAGMMPAGADVQKFNRILDFLETLPFVDKDREAFYGLSYGGYTALWTAPGVPRFKAVVCSGHFNHWQAKTTDPTIGTSYLFYDGVSDMYNFGVLNSLDHSDLAALIAPRPFLIEMGDQDGVIVEPRMLVENEIRQVAEHYRSVGHTENFSVARFAGPHRIDGAEAYPFLERMLKR